jgi:DNA adenine methylase
MNISVDLFTPHVASNLIWKYKEEKSSYPKSPLRYPGGKARAVSILLSLIPSNIEVLVSPFIGGGSLEIAIAHLGIKVLGFDIFDPLVSFWQELLTNPSRLADNVQKYIPLEKKIFYELQDSYPSNRLDIATQFYVLNRASFSGATMSGGMSPGHPRFTQSSIDYLRQFFLPNLYVQKQDFHLTLSYETNSFLYLDPPYLIESNLYGRKGNTHKDFDHHGLWKLLKNRNNWIMSYNNCDEIRDLYKDFRILFPEWKYGMSSSKQSKEIIILSNDMPEVIGG